MDINVNINVNSQPLVEASNKLKETNTAATNLNKTLKDKTPETQIGRNTNEITKSGRAMTGLRTAVNGFDKLVGSEIGGATETVGALGQTFVGLGRALPLVTGAFRAMGAALMSNPIFLIGSVIAGLVVALGGLTGAFGFLQPVIESIGSFINGLIEGFKTLASWIGFTTEKVEEGTKKNNDYEKSLERISTQTNENITLAERELALARAQEQPVSVLIALEEKLNREKRKGATEIFDKSTKAYLEQLNVLNNLIKGTKEYTEAEEKMDKIRSNLNESGNEIIRIDGELNVLRVEGGKKILEERKKNAEKQISIIDDQQKLEVLKTKENTKEKLMAQIEEANQTFEIRKKLAKDLQLTELDIKILDQEKINRIDELTKQLEKYDVFQYKILGDWKKVVAETRTTTESLALPLPDNEEWLKKMRERIVLSRQIEVDRTKATLEDETLTYSERMSKLNEFYKNTDSLNEAQRQIELTKVDEDSKEAEAINLKWDNIRIENEKKKAETIRQINKATFDGALKSAESVIDAFGAVSDAFLSIKKQNLEKGSVEEEKAAREEFEVRKKMSIASAIISGIQGVVNILSAPSILPIEIASIYKGIQVAALAVTTAAQIAKISSQQFESPSSSVGSTPGSTTTPAAPSFNLFGQGNQMNVSSAQPTTTVSDPQGNVLRVVAEVSETEITAVQMRNRRYSNSAEL